MIIGMETTCGALLRELEHIWIEIGESEEDKDRMLVELERECLQVYRRKVEEASSIRSQLRQSLVANEAELVVLVDSLGEDNVRLKMEKKLSPLKEQLASVTPLLEDLRVKKEERLKQFSEILSQIEKIGFEMTGYGNQYDGLSSPIKVEEHDLSIRRLTEYQTQLHNLQKEKSERLQKVLEYVNEVHSLCALLEVDFSKTVDEVHPSLHETGSGQCTNISDRTLEGLAQAITKLKTEKKMRFRRLREAVESLIKLWNLMDSSEEEKRRFGEETWILGSSEEDITYPAILSLDTVEQTETEVERLTKLKTSRLKELILTRRLELEERCRSAHLEPDISTSLEESFAMIDSGLVDPAELLANTEAQIVKVKEESVSRKEIMDKVDKWLAACEEENWLEEYNQDVHRYSTSRGAHWNLKRAEKARKIVSKIPAFVDNLMDKTFAWEDERNMPFLYDGVRLVAFLEEYKLARQQREEEKKRHRDQKKLQSQLLREKESIYGSKPSPHKSNGSNRKTNGYHANGHGNGVMTPASRRVSLGSATPELLTPRSCSGHQNGYFKETRRLSTAPLNYVAIPKAEPVSSFATARGSEPGSLPLG